MQYLVFFPTENSSGVVLIATVILLGLLIFKPNQYSSELLKNVWGKPSDSRRLYTDLDYVQVMVKMPQRKQPSLQKPAAEISALTWCMQ